MSVGHRDISPLHHTGLEVEEAIFCKSKSLLEGLPKERSYKVHPRSSADYSSALLPRPRVTMITGFLYSTRKCVPVKT
jgi:hypothetical protein